MVNSKRSFSSVDTLNALMYINVTKNRESSVAKETGVISGMNYRGVLLVPNTHQQERTSLEVHIAGLAKGKDSRIDNLKRDSLQLQISLQVQLIIVHYRSIDFFHSVSIRHPNTVLIPSPC